MASFNEITAKQVARLIGTPDAPTIIDVRIDEDFEHYPRLIPGSCRWPYDKANAFPWRGNTRKTIVCCHQGLKLSQGFAAFLRIQGIDADVLSGGTEAWRIADLPSVIAASLPAPAEDGGTSWVTRHRPKIDRIACPWLIRRFVDPNARFMFISPSQVLNVAERFNATPFDVEDVPLSHLGERCTFETMIEAFGLKIEALDRLAMIVRAADTDRLDLAPQAAGLLAASLGLSRMYRNDLAQLEAGMGLYDAFYRWSRDAVDETHDWPADAKRV